MSFEETMARLDGILGAEEERRRIGAAGLLAARSRLDAVGLLPDGPEPTERGVPDRRESAPRPRFAPLPRRTTHGGRFGPSVAAKLRSEALRKSW